MQFRLYITTDNAAFEDPGELPRILRKIASDIEDGRDIGHFQTILDANGNDVGRYALKEEALYA
jgi:hypothetical protein